VRPVPVLGLAVLVLAHLGAVEAAPRPCTQPNVVVSATDPGDFDTGCRGAAAAARFLAASGVDTRVPIEIWFVDVMPEAAGGAPAVGCYVRSVERIYMLTFARCSTRRMSHGVAVDRSLHRGLVAHEVAHRLVTVHVRPATLGTIASEYIAYVTMYAAMPAAHREQVLKRIPGHGFGAEVEINATMYMLDPVYFGAQAWRHYGKPGIGRPFLESVLKGQALGEDEPR
jgi:hypothetical protein